MDKNLSIQNEKELQKTLQQESQNTRLQERKTLDRIEDLLQKDLQADMRATEQRQQVDRQEEIKNVNELKQLISEHIKPGTVQDSREHTKTVLDTAIKESQQMAKLSDQAKSLKHQTYSKEIDDIAQVSKKDVTDIAKNITTEHHAATSKAIEEDTRYNLKTIKIAEDLAVKNQDTRRNTGKDQAELNSEHAARTEKQENSTADLSFSSDTNYNSDKESRGKELIKQKQEENAKQAPPAHHDHLPPQPQHKPHVNKLKAKFQKSSLHF